ncbi:tyrosine-type recombinase/integrase [Okeania sp. SIO1I7]|uniref:tyrosine-type recombinase/integrase n=1 Tax=Okeania sp. SIO1I7 TaxID=2607772 RepID=UPI0013FBDC97|nr:tyrosine-type recombinase/integrase [Okeania sp. SIO1I7]NET29969.1 tyrosine-type recombinase/integrase [Okeania sp. SIO1I7]
MENLSLCGQDHLGLTNPVPLTQHPVGVYLASLSPGSVVTMRHSLNTMASLLTRGECDAITLDWSKLRYQHTAALKVVLRQKYSPSTVNKMLCALRRVLKEAVRLDLIDPKDYSNAIDLSNMRVRGKPRGRALTRSEITQLLEVCQSDAPIDVRDTALIAILRGTGLRRAEVVKLDLEDFDASTGEVRVRLGKGGKDRMVYLPRSAIALVENWLRVRGFMPGPLLCPVNKGGNLQMRRMCPDAVLKILKKRALQAGVEEFSPHDFRRTFCSDLLDASVDIVTVQKLAGHASPVTTAKYDRRGEETKRRAVQKLEL